MVAALLYVLPIIAFACMGVVEYRRHRH